MRSYLDILEYAYREESTSTFTHDGVEYNLNCVLSAAADIPSQMTPVSQLVWLLDEAGYYDSNRVNSADLDAPLLIVKWNNRMVVLDGLHRLSKAAQMGVPLIRTVTIPESYLLGCSMILKESHDPEDDYDNEEMFADGYWITYDGEIIQCDYHMDRHHADIAMDHFTMPEDGREPNDAATAEGWIRILRSANVLVCELNPKAVTEKALRVLRREVNKSDVDQFELNSGSLSFHYSRGSFLVALRRELDKAKVLAEDEDLRSAAHFEIGRRPWIMSPDPVRWAGKDDDLYVAAHPDAAEERIQFYLDLFKTGSTVAYRVMWLKPEHVVSLKAGDHLGLCWASKMEDFNSFALSGYNDDVSDKPLYILEAEIPQSSVDWRATIQQNFDAPWEYEIVVNHGSPLKLRSIRDTGEPYIAYVNHHDGKPIRPELTGVVFKG